MRTELTNLLLEGLSTYLIHSSVLIVLAAAVSTLKLVKSGALRETLWRIALFGALVTTPVQMAGSFTPLFGILSPPEISYPTQESVELAVKNPSPAGDVQVNPTATPEPLATAMERLESGDDPQATSRAFSLSESLLFVWAGFSLALLFRLLVSAGDLRWQLKTRRTLDSGRAHKIACALRRRAGLRWLKVSVSPSLTTPFTLPGGEIVLPEWALSLPRSKLKAMLAHETGHVVRRDPYWVIAGEVVQALFFFQPLNLLARRRLQASAEYACDEWASHVCGSGRELAECIAECAHRYLHGPAGAFGAAMAASRSEAVKRAERLLSGVSEFARPASPALKAGAAALVIGLGLVLPGFAMGGMDNQMLYLDVGSGIAVRTNNGRYACSDNGHCQFEMGPARTAEMTAESYDPRPLEWTGCDQLPAPNRCVVDMSDGIATVRVRHTLRHSFR